ncbi:MAG TPA: tetratricopeptide repeat protein [Acidobacteriaceae bacterium]|nr:tetratricopeptide repeat protein [Acidobacteriaceae bacterium]
MRRILLCALLAIISAPSLSAEDPNTALANLSDLSRRGQLPQLIQAASSLLEADQLNPTDRAMTLTYLGYAYQQTGEFTKATANYEKALAVLERDGQHPSEYAATLGPLATVYAQIGQIDTAKHLLLRSVHLFENENDHGGAAMAWNDLAAIAAQQHLRHEAHKDMARSNDEQQLASNMTPGELAAITTTAGRIAELDGDARTAIQDYGRALELWKQTNQDQQQRTAWLYVLLGGAYLQAGDIADARETAGRGLALFEATSGRQSPRYFAAQLTYAKVLDASGAHNEAATLRKEAQESLNTATDRQRAQSEISVSALR